VTRAVVPNQGATREGPQVEVVEAQQPVRLGVGRVEQLEASIEPESVLHVSAHPTANTVRPLQDNDLETGRAQVSRGGKAGEPGADHHDIDARAIHQASVRRARPRPIGAVRSTARILHLLAR